MCTIELGDTEMFTFKLKLTINNNKSLVQNLRERNCTTKQIDLNSRSRVATFVELAPWANLIVVVIELLLKFS